MGLFGPPNIEKLKKAGKADRLIKALNEKETDIRLAAVKALRDISASDALGGLSQLVLSDTDNTVREEAFKAY
jgi:HEAT repeat protein